MLQMTSVIATTTLMHSLLQIEFGCECAFATEASLDSISRSAQTHFGLGATRVLGCPIGLVLSLAFLRGRGFSTTSILGRLLDCGTLPVLMSLGLELVDTWFEAASLPSSVVIALFTTA